MEVGGICIVKAQEWLTQFLKGKRENLKSWERRRERREKARKKPEHFPSALGFTKVSTHNCVVRTHHWEKKLVSPSEICWSLERNQTNTFTLCPVIPIFQIRYRSLSFFILQVDFNFNKISCWNMSLIIMIWCEWNSFQHIHCNFFAFFLLTWDSHSI